MTQRCNRRQCFTRDKGQKEDCGGNACQSSWASAIDGHRRNRVRSFGVRSNKAETAREYEASSTERGQVFHKPAEPGNAAKKVTHHCLTLEWPVLAGCSVLNIEISSLSASLRLCNGKVREAAVARKGCCLRGRRRTVWHRCRRVGSGHLGRKYTIRKRIAVQFCSMPARRRLILPEVKAGYIGNLGTNWPRRSVRIENIDQRPWSSGQVIVKSSLFVDNEFARRKQESGALGRIGIIQIELANRQFEGLGRRWRIGFIACMRATGDKGDLPSGWR